MRTCHLCCCWIFSLSTSHVCSLKVNFEVTFLQRFRCHIIVRGFWFFSFSAECHLSTLNIMHMYIWWNSVSLYLNFKFLVCLCLVYTDHVYPKTELDIVIFGYKYFVFRRHSVAMKGSGNVLFVLFSFAPDIVCCLRGTMRQTFSNTTPSLGQECEWESLRGWCQPLPDGASSIPETPFSSLQQLSRPRDRCGGGGGGTAMQYTTPTLYTSNNKWALIKFFCVLFFYTKLPCEGELGHGVD